MLCRLTVPPGVVIVATLECHRYAVFQILKEIDSTVSLV